MAVTEGNLLDILKLKTNQAIFKNFSIHFPVLVEMEFSVLSKCHPLSKGVNVSFNFSAFYPVFSESCFRHFYSYLNALITSLS